MPFLPDDDRLLHRALALAQAASAFASPNPTVGCVLARDARVLGEGAHRYDLRDHAEILALQDAAARGDTVGGATAFVTLEPCSHHGRTGPCADALVAAGVTRCVIATVDPNPLVRGSGLAKLRTAGVDVVVADPASSVAQAARRLNDAFAFSIQHGRPFVTLKAAVSHDGKLAPPPFGRTDRAPFWLTGPVARADVQQLRHASDALLTGIGTVLADDPELTDRTGLPRRRPLLRLVLDADLRTPLRSRLVRTAHGDVTILTAPHASTAREQALGQAGVEVLRLPTNANSRLDLPSVLATLAAIPIRSLMVEAGAMVNGSFLAANLVDRVVLYRASVELGPSALPFAQGQPSPSVLLAKLTSLTEQTFAHDQAEDVRVEGYLHDPWADIVFE